MTIQLSVVIWTIINFILLYLVLHFLLFKPMLKVMDDRNAKIKQGQSLVAKKRAAAEEEKKAAEEFALRREKLLAEKIDAGLESVKAQCRAAQLEAEAKDRNYVAADRAALEEEEHLLRDKLAASIPTLTDAVVQRLLEKGL